MEKKKVILRWTNKYSKETGFVKSVSKKDKCFINTFDRNDARAFATMAAAKNALHFLEAFGECENNDFSIEEV